MIRINVNGVSATVTAREILTAGRVGLECELTFDGEWDGLFKTAVFQGIETIEVALTSAVCTVPYEALAVEGVQLKIGVYGANGAGTIVIPTVWANAGKILPSAGAVPPDTPTQTVNAYAVEKAEQAYNIALGVQQKAENGDFDGAPGVPGPQGADGFSPSANVVMVGDRATITITDKNGTTTAHIHNGADGLDGAPGATGPAGPQGATGPKGDTGETGPAGADGSTIWTTTVAPAEPMGGGYEFMVSDLDGASGGAPAVGDLIFYDSAYYPITSVTGHTIVDKKAIADRQVDIRGEAATIEDGSITKEKLVAALSSEITQNTEDVADLKSAINDLEAASDDVNIKMGWRIGDMSNGSYNPLNYRICSGIVTFPNAVMFRCRDGYQLYTVSYKSDGTVDKSISFRAAIQIPANMPFSLTIRKSPESTSTSAVLADFIAGVYLDAYTGTGDYPIFERGNLTQPSNPGQRATSSLIPGTVGRISICSDGYDHYLEPYTLDGTKLTDTSWVSGSADYSLDPNKNYIVVFAVTGARTTPIDFSDLSRKVAIYRIATGMPDMLAINADKIPLIQQTFVGRPTLTGATDSVLSFLWFSDIHKEQKQWDRSILLANYYQRNFAFAIHTGDYVGNDQSNYEQLYQNGVTPAIPMLNVVGNHDIYTNFANKTLAEKSVTKGIIMPDTTAWGVTWSDGASPMNYYKDFAEQKIRLVVLDDYYDTEEQVTWLATVLSDAQTLGYHVITAAHETSRPITTWSDNTFCSKDAAALTTGNLNHSATPYDAVIKAWKDGGGIHIAHICGHEHVDLMGKSANGVLNIVIGSQHGYYADASDAMRIKETVTEDLVNVVGINTNIGLIKIVRVGVNTDHYLRGRNVLCYDYINDIVVANY